MLTESNEEYQHQMCQSTGLARMPQKCRGRRAGSPAHSRCLRKSCFSSRSVRSSQPSKRDLHLAQTQPLRPVSASGTVELAVSLSPLVHGVLQTVNLHDVEGMFGDVSTVFWVELTQLTVC